jgi:hypothetical protein
MLYLRYTPLASQTGQIGLVHADEVRLGYDHWPLRTNRTAPL